VDLYRVSGEEELRYLGWGELDDGFRLVEWPERAPGLAAHADIEVRLAYEGTGRDAEIIGLSQRGAALVAQLEGTRQTKPVD
jgi:tRNA threonylcarbamoyladenosine biosynthesis protein TsaE